MPVADKLKNWWRLNRPEDLPEAIDPSPQGIAEYVEIATKKVLDLLTVEQLDILVLSYIQDAILKGLKSSMGLNVNFDNGTVSFDYNSPGRIKINALKGQIDQQIADLIPNTILLSEEEVDKINKDLQRHIAEITRDHVGSSLLYAIRQDILLQTQEIMKKSLETGSITFDPADSTVIAHSSDLETKYIKRIRKKKDIQPSTSIANGSTE